WGGNGNVQVEGNTSIAGDLSVSSNLHMAAGMQITAPGRLHIAGDENLFVLNKSGMIVSKAWGGNGNVHVEGNATVDGNVAMGTGNFNSRLNIGGNAN